MSKKRMSNAEFAAHLLRQHEVAAQQKQGSVIPVAPVVVVGTRQGDPKQIEKQERKQKRKQQCWRVLKAFVKAYPLGLTDYELVGRMIGGTDGPRRRRELRRMGINFTVRSDASKGVSRWSLTNRQQGIDKLREQGIEIASDSTV